MAGEEAGNLEVMGELRRVPGVVPQRLLRG